MMHSMKSTGKQKSVLVGIFFILVLFFIGTVQFITNVKEEVHSVQQANLATDKQVVIPDLKDEERIFNAQLAVIDQKDQSELVRSQNQAQIFSTVKIPLLASQLKYPNMEGKRRLCDIVVMTEKNIQPTTQPLMVALKELFMYEPTVRFNPGNFAVTQKNIFFHGVTIENKTAKVYLLGTLGPVSGSCDRSRLQIQIEETVLQYPTMEKVEIYLNEILFTHN